MSGLFRDGGPITRLSERDRRSLVILGVFLAAVAYYLLLFEPVYARWQASRAEVQGLRLELTNAHRKVGEHDAWESDYHELSRRLGVIGSRIRMPGPDVGVAQVVEGIMEAAKEAGVEINSLRPTPTLREDGTEVIDTFIIEGAATTGGFVSFISGVWGLRLAEASLTKTDRGTQPIRFYVRLVRLSGGDFEAIRAEADPSYSPAAFSSTADLFSQKLPPRPARRPQSAPPPAARPKTLNLSGLELVGISNIDGRRMAIVNDRSDGQTLFLMEGDKARDFAVESISETAIIFRSGDLTGRLALPEVGS